MNIAVVGLLGASGGALNELCDHAIRIPSEDTARIQEAHILIGHILCELIEQELFGQ
jgi:D-sedoheptulose 7-phosphate isomerase